MKIISRPCPPKTHGHGRWWAWAWAWAPNVRLCFPPKQFLKGLALPSMLRWFQAIQFEPNLTLASEYMVKAKSQILVNATHGHVFFPFFPPPWKRQSTLSMLFGNNWNQMVWVLGHSERWNKVFWRGLRKYSHKQPFFPPSLLMLEDTVIIVAQGLKPNFWGSLCFWEMKYRVMKGAPKVCRLVAMLFSTSPSSWRVHQTF